MEVLDMEPISTVYCIKSSLSVTILIASAIIQYQEKGSPWKEIWQEQHEQEAGYNVFWCKREDSVSSMQHCETVQLLFLSDLTLKNYNEWCKLEDLNLKPWKKSLLNLRYIKKIKIHIFELITKVTILILVSSKC